MKKFAKAIASGVLCLVVIGAATPWVLAHSGAEGIVKERMDMMKGMADAMKVMGAMVKGGAPFDAVVVADKAGYLARHAGMIPEMTPEGSDDHPSEVLPVTWQAWDDYVAGADALAAEGAKLVTIANDGADEAAMRAQYLKVSETCGACHDRFRKPKDEN